MHDYTTLAGQIYEIEELNWITYLILPTKHGGIVSFFGEWLCSQENDWVGWELLDW